jgi:hypothetical protein
MSNDIRSRIPWLVPDGRPIEEPPSAGMKAMRASVARLKHPRFDAGIGTSGVGSDPSLLAFRTGSAARHSNSSAHSVDWLWGSHQTDDTRPPLHADAIERFATRYRT